PHYFANTPETGPKTGVGSASGSGPCPSGFLRERADPAFAIGGDLLLFEECRAVFGCLADEVRGPVRLSICSTSERRRVTDFFSVGSEGCGKGDEANLSSQDVGDRMTAHRGQ